MWTTEILERMNNTMLIVKKDGNVRGSVKFFTRTDDANEDGEAEELKEFVVLIELMNTGANDG